MTPNELLTYVKRRLAENGVTVTAERELELFDNITEARDEVLGEIADVAPNVIGTWVTLEVDPADDRKYSLPAATKDPIRVYELRDPDSRIPFDKTVNLDSDLGEYQPIGVRSWRFSQESDLAQGVEALVVPMLAPIEAGDDETTIGLPTDCHRAIGRGAAMLSLTVDEESAATVATGLYERALDKLRDHYGEKEAAGGTALRHALMKSLGEHVGDMIY